MFDLAIATLLLPFSIQDALQKPLLFCLKGFEAFSPNILSLSWHNCLSLLEKNIDDSSCTNRFLSNLILPSSSSHQCRLDFLFLKESASAYSSCHYNNHSLRLPVLTSGLFSRNGEQSVSIIIIGTESNWAPVMKASQSKKVLMINAQNPLIFIISYRFCIHVVTQNYQMLAKCCKSIFVLRE